MATTLAENPVEEVKKSDVPKVAQDKTVILRRMITNKHEKANRVDIKPVSETRWRVNVFYADNGLVRKLTLSHSYFVKLENEIFLFDPPLK